MNQADWDLYMESARSNSERMQDERHFEAEQKVEAEKIEIQRQELQVKQQEQETQQVLVYGGVGIAGLLVVVITIFLVIKLIRGKRK